MALTVRRDQVYIVLAMVTLLGPLIAVTLYLRDTDNRTRANLSRLDEQRKVFEAFHEDQKEARTEVKADIEALRGNVETEFDRIRDDFRSHFGQFATRTETEAFLNTAIQRSLVEIGEKWASRFEVLMREQYRLDAQHLRLEGRVDALEKAKP